MDDKNLIKRCQNGDKSAFNELIRCFYPYVSKFLFKLTCNETLSEDLTHETFLKIIRSIEKYNLHGAAGFGTYLMTVAKNTYIDYLRKNKTQNVDIDELALADSVPGVSGETIAFLLGFYDRFLTSLNNIISGSKDEKKAAVIFLLKLGVGWVI